MSNSALQFADWQSNGKIGKPIVRSALQVPDWQSNGQSIGGPTTRSALHDKFNCKIGGPMARSALH